MKINRRSWHYKINWLNDFDCCSNLCSYFWHLFFSIFIPIMVVLFFGTVIFLYFGDPGVAFGIHMLLLAALAWWLSFFTITFLREKFNKPLEIPKENILKEYIKAKKNKICPMIDYIN